MFASLLHISTVKKNDGKRPGVAKKLEDRISTKRRENTKQRKRKYLGKRVTTFGSGLGCLGMFGAGEL